jgi:hypothetical protein
MHEMEFILMKLADDTSLESSRIRASLQSICFKAKVGLATGSYQPKPRPTLVDKLGFAISSPDDARYLAGEMNPEEEERYLAAMMKGESI